MIDQLLTTAVLKNVIGCAGNINAVRYTNDNTLSKISQELTTLKLKASDVNDEIRIKSAERAIVVSLLVERMTKDGLDFLMVVPVVSGLYNNANERVSEQIVLNFESELSRQVNEFSYVDLVKPGTKEKAIISDVLRSAANKVRELMVQSHTEHQYLIVMNHHQRSGLSVEGAYVVSKCTIEDYRKLLGDVLLSSETTASYSFHLRQLVQMSTATGQFTPTGVAFAERALIGAFDDDDFVVKCPKPIQDSIAELGVIGSFIHYSVNYTDYYKYGLQQHLQYFVKQSMNSLTEVEDVWLSGLDKTNCI